MTHPDNSTPKEGAAKDRLDLTDIVGFLNKAWRECGQSGEFVLKSDMITVTEKEVIVKMPVVCTVRISKDKVDVSTLEAVSPAISHAVSAEKGV